MTRRDNEVVSSGYKPNFTCTLQEVWISCPTSVQRVNTGDVITMDSDAMSLPL